MVTAIDVERQFARPFAQCDWSMFKAMADAYLQEAAKLKRGDMPRYGVNTLLARNVRKRLLIGLGVELLLKALFLKRGYAINLTPKGGKPFPARFEEHEGTTFRPKTAQLDDCIKHVDAVATLADEDLEGLKIAKVFRNKEAHSVIDRHPFVPDTYRAIESSLVAVYQDGFSEELVVRIAMTGSDTAAWKIKSIRR